MLEWTTWNVLLETLIRDVHSQTAYSSSEDQPNFNADLNDQFLQARAV